MQKFGNIEVLTGSCNLSTILDGRGGIFTWPLRVPMVEMNLIYYQPNKVRGNHYHPEFDEFYLIVEGSGALVTKDPVDGSNLVMHGSKGTCLWVPKNTSHAFHPITQATAISMISKPWDECDDPIIHEHLVPYDEQYVKYADEQGFKYSIEEKKKPKK